MSLAESYSLEVVDPAVIVAYSEPGAHLEEWLGLRPAWMVDAACRDEPTDVFFPGRGHDPQPAKQVCETCPVQFACLRYALDDPTLCGVWGGTTETERRAIRRGVAS